MFCDVFCALLHGLKAWFHDGFLREKFRAKWIYTCAVKIIWASREKFRFTSESWSWFYSLRNKRIWTNSKDSIIFRKNNFSRRISPSWNHALITVCCRLKFLNLFCTRHCNLDLLFITHISSSKSPTRVCLVQFLISNKTFSRCIFYYKHFYKILLKLLLVIVIYLSPL